MYILPKRPSLPPIRGSSQLTLGHLDDVIIWGSACHRMGVAMLNRRLLRSDGRSLVDSLLFSIRVSAIFPGGERVFSPISRRAPNVAIERSIPGFCTPHWGGILVVTPN